MRKALVDEFERARYSLFCGDPMMYRLLYVFCLDPKTIDVFFRQLFAGEYTGITLANRNLRLQNGPDRERQFTGP